jgi:hypothetical protein
MEPIITRRLNRAAAQAYAENRDKPDSAYSKNLARMRARTTKSLRPIFEYMAQGLNDVQIWGQVRLSMNLLPNQIPICRKNIYLRLEIATSDEFFAKLGITVPDRAPAPEKQLKSPLQMKPRRRKRDESQISTQRERQFLRQERARHSIAMQDQNLYSRLGTGERALLNLACNNASIPDIADTLHIPVIRARVLVSALFNKLNIQNEGDEIPPILAMRFGCLQLPSAGPKPAQLPNASPSA